MAANKEQGTLNATRKTLTKSLESILFKIELFKK